MGFAWRLREQSPFDRPYSSADAGILCCSLGTILARFPLKAGLTASCSPSSKASEYLYQTKLDVENHYDLPALLRLACRSVLCISFRNWLITESLRILNGVDVYHLVIAEHYLLQLLLCGVIEYGLLKRHVLAHVYVARLLSDLANVFIFLFDDAA